MGQSLRENPDAALAGATPYLRLFGLVAGQHYLARAALAVSRDGAEAGGSIALARFFAENLLVAAPGLAETVTGGAESVLGVDPHRISA